MVVPIVLQQHAEDAAILHATRTALTSAPHVKLRHLRRFDDRLEAHLDGLAVAGESGWSVLEPTLELPLARGVFPIAVRAIEDRDTDRLDRLFALVGAMPEIRGGLTSAFGWMESERLRGIVVELLRSQDPLRRRIGVAASAMHRIDPGLRSAGYVEDPDPSVRARAWRAAGELSQRQLMTAAMGALVDEVPTCRFWAAWSAVLMGDRERALEALVAVALEEGPQRAGAFQLTIQAMAVSTAHEWLECRFAPDPANRRRLLRGAGFVGDPAYVPWLVSQMTDESVGRLAGESFSMITGVDLAWLDLERKPPEGLESGPNDDPDDPNVDMDPDEGLPWPDQERVQAWWDQNGQRFTTGVRHFMGATVSRKHCIDVLKDGYQRQRIAAAYHLCLLNPGTPLFEWRAPAWRQQRELVQMK